VKKAISLALVLVALAIAWAFTPVPWKPGPERAHQLSNGPISPVVVGASASNPAEAAEPPELPQSVVTETMTILLPSRNSGENVKGLSQPYRDSEPLRLVRDLQRELKRVGCYAHDIDGEWTPGTRNAMRDFTDRVNAALSAERPDPTQLILLQRHREPVCGEICRRGASLADNRCVANSQVALESKKAAATTAPPLIVWTKSYVTPASPEPDLAEAAPASEVAPRPDPAPRPRRHTSRAGGGGSFLFGIFGW
jgi:peptidoglycan hydrolase-like protein with peptidoglycan-binding domain